MGLFDRAPINNRFDVITGSATAIQLPDRPCLTLRMKAQSPNKGSFFVGTSLTNCAYEIDANEELRDIFIPNLSCLCVRNPSGSSDKLSIWWQF